MGRSKLHALARSLTLMASVGAPCLAHAADLLPPPPPPPMPVPVDVGGGWYLRGDVGVGAAEFHGVNVYADLPPAYKVDQPTLGDQFFAGAGVGYQFNSFLRGDITGEYRGGGKIKFSDQYFAYDQNTGQQLFNKDGTPSHGINLYDGKLRSIVVMANGYIDLGTWFCLTPYIGGGIGTAFHQVSGFSDVGAGKAAGGFGFAPSKNSTSLAWSAQAGVSYDVTPNFKVDVGYRYLDMGSAKTGGVTCFDDPGCRIPTSYKIKDLDSHDVKVGLRYLIGGVAAAPLPSLAPAYEPGPLVRKY